jgi:hypothetical protein
MGEKQSNRVDYSMDSSRVDGIRRVRLPMHNIYFEAGPAANYARTAKRYCDWMKGARRASIEAVAIILDHPSQIFACKTFGPHDEELLANWMRSMDLLGTSVVLPMPGTVTV